MADFEPLIWELGNPEPFRRVPSLAVYFFLADGKSVAWSLRIRAAPVVAGTFCGRMQVTGYKQIQGLPVLAFCWIWQLHLKPVDMLDKWAKRHVAAPCVRLLISGVFEVCSHLLSSVLLKVIWSSECFPQVRGVMLQASFLLRWSCFCITNDWN